MRTLVRAAGLALLALLALAPTAGASSVSLQNSVVVYDGDTAADNVELRRVQQNGRTYYLVYDDQSMAGGQGCTNASNLPFVYCEVGTALRRYDLRTGTGDDIVQITGDTLGGSTDLGPGNDSFTGRATGTSPDTVRGGDGDDVLKGGTGSDRIFGDGGTDQVAGEAGNDAVDGGAGNDQLEFGGERWPRAPGSAPTTSAAAPAPTA